VNVDSNALCRPVSIDERSRPVPAAVDLPLPTESRDQASSQQAVEVETWEDEDGTTAVAPPEVPSQRPKSHFDEISG
jgi:hypothetical protein